jgi:hypothetical protein
MFIPNSSMIRFAYVSVSRASQDAQIFTNDAATLVESLSRDVTKASALDFAKANNSGCEGWIGTGCGHEDRDRVQVLGLGL